MDRLLILACSKRKRPDRENLPAIERYDGPVFRLLRHYLSQAHGKPHVYVLSAEYGLIASEELIPYYDRCMTPQRARELRSQVMVVLRHILLNATHKGAAQPEVFLNLGRTYHEAMEDAYDWLSRNSVMTVANGSQGSRLSQMRVWLYGMVPLRDAFVSRQYNVEGKIKLRGVEITLSASQVMKTAHKVLSQQPLVNTGGQTWYVMVNGRRVGPKWLVGQVTGLPVRAFHTDEARRVLYQLGIEVQLDL